ncbi:MAG: RNA 3'-terminal phosphate cyclase [Polyangiaceae bacterium]
MITIDGSSGEGGGQILRTSLALSLVTGTPVRVTGIRKRRSKPGLLRQHLTAVRAATEIGDAEVTGDALLSTEVTFHPRAVLTGARTFAIGTAGSTTLVLQTVLPALLLAKEPTTLTLTGGTHNPMAPSFDHLARAYLPQVERMGPRIAASLEQAGFFPAGGGRIVVHVTPAKKLAPLDLLERGEVRRVTGVATVANLPSSIALREIASARAILDVPERGFRPEVLRDVAGPGNVVTLTVESAHVTEVFTAFGERNVRAEVVGEKVAQETKAYLEAGVPVGEHLADQLLLPMALAGKGTFRTLAPSSHTTTHAELLEKILGVRTRIDRETEATYRVEVGG